MATLKVTNIKNESFAGDQLYLKTDGKIGIGTTSPNHLLHVEGALSGTTGFNFTNTHASGYGLYVKGGGTGNYAFRVDNQAGSEALRIVDGKVGIGTTSPSRKLHLVGSNAMILIEGSGGNGRQYSLASSDDTTGAAVDGGNAGTFAIYDDTANASRLVINSSGNVGIGTTSPTYPLHVAGEGIAVDRNAGDSYIAMRTGGTSTAFIYAGVANGLRFWTLPSGGSLTERVRVTNDDVTSFGNTSPNAWQTGGGYYNIQLGNAGYLRADTDAGGNFFSNGVNLYRDNSGWKFIENGRGTQISHGTGNTAITFYGTNSGNADGTPSFFEMLRLDVNGDVVCGSGNLVLTDGQGIYFGADGNAGGMTSELLDDYEEGTWTPTMATSNGNLTATYTVQTGTYTKVGRLVYVMFDITVSDTPTGSAGHPQIRGLPFTPVVGQSSQGGYPVPQFRDSGAMPVDARLYNSSYGHSSDTAIWIQYYNSSGTIQQPNGSTWWAQGRCQGEMVYYAT